MSDLFSEEELDALLSSALLGGATDKQAQKLYHWAVITYIRCVLLREVLTGKYIVSVRRDGEPRMEGKRKKTT